MNLPRFPRCWLLGLIVLAGPSTRGADPEPPKPSDNPSQFILHIAEDGSLTLDGRKVAREDLAKASARLAEKVVLKAKTGGKDIDPKQGLPAVVVIWGPDETPYSVISALMLDLQASGFQFWSFAPKSDYPDPPADRRPETTDVPPLRKKSDLPDLIRTIPIRLRAGDRGLIDSVVIGEKGPQDFNSFRFELSMIQDDPDTPFDQAFLKVDSKLVFSEVVRTTRLLQKYRIKRISLTEIRPGDE